IFSHILSRCRAFLTSPWVLSDGIFYLLLSEIFSDHFSSDRYLTVCFSLMAAQALLYNAIFFSHPLALPRFFDVSLGSVGWYFLPFAVGNFLGPLLLGPLFDRVGRKSMISSTYLLSGILIAISAYVFNHTAGSALTISLAWMITFFFASAAASAAYLT